MGAETVGKVATASKIAGLYGINGTKKPETSLEFQKIINEHIEEMTEKVKNGQVQQKFMIGNQEFTLEEWEELLKKFDDMEKEIIEETKAAAEEALEEWLAADDEKEKI